MLSRANSYEQQPRTRKNTKFGFYRVIKGQHRNVCDKNIFGLKRKWIIRRNNTPLSVNVPLLANKCCNKISDH